MTGIAKVNHRGSYIQVDTCFGNLKLAGLKYSEDLSQRGRAATDSDLISVGKTRRGFVSFDHCDNIQRLLFIKIKKLGQLE